MIKDLYFQMVDYIKNELKEKEFTSDDFYNIAQIDGLCPINFSIFKRFAKVETIETYKEIPLTMEQVKKYLNGECESVNDFILKDGKFYYLEGITKYKIK